MGHNAGHSAYRQLTKRLNRSPQGAPPSQHLYKILSILFSEREASLVALVPQKPFTVQTAARVWGLSTVEAQKTLDDLADRALMVDFEQNGRSLYVLPPPMAGFFEFSMMRTRDDIDQKLLAELFHQYITVEDEFALALFTEGETQLGRTFVNEGVLTGDNSIHVLDYERASEVIETATHMGISDCYCRHKMLHMDRVCDAPMNICMTFNTTADSLIRHGHARSVDLVEGHELLAEARENNLVQFGENVREKVNFICNCCGCCCEAMIAQRRFAVLNPVHTTNFLPVVDANSCTGCGKCVNLCPVEAMTLVSANDHGKPDRKLARLIEERCLGCGVCLRGCNGAGSTLRLEERGKRVFTPLNGAHKAILMALERGKLQDLIFDNRLMWSHRTLAALVGAILKLPPAKKALATKQVKSRYLEKLARKYS